MVAAVVSLALASFTSYLAITGAPDNASTASIQQAATVTGQPTASPSPAPSEQPLGPSATPVPGGGTRLRLSGPVLFDRDSAVLRPGARRIIEDLARRLRAAAGGSVTVIATPTTSAQPNTDSSSPGNAPRPSPTYSPATSAAPPFGSPRPAAASRIR